MHRALLPLDELDLGSDGVLARLTPYRSRVSAHGELTLTATVRNPFGDRCEAMLRLVLPEGFSSRSGGSVWLEAGEEVDVPLRISAGPGPRSRQRVALDVTIGDLMLGQHAEALVEVG